MDVLWNFLQVGILGNFAWGNIIMLLIGCVFIYLGIARDYEPLLLVPIGFGMLVGNIPLSDGMNVGIYESGSVLNVLYSGVTQGWYPSLIFLGIGAMTDFSAMLSNPRLILLEKLKKSASQGSMGKFPDPGKSEMETSKSREL